MENPFFTSVPLRYKKVFCQVKRNMRFISFRKKFFVEEKGWKYYSDKYIGEDEEGFPHSTALKKFQRNMNFIEKNFPDIRDRYFILKALKRMAYEFNLIDEKKWEEEVIELEGKQEEYAQKFLKRYKREIEISQQIRKTFIKAYIEYDYEWSGRAAQDAREYEYIDKWIDQTVTLEEWEEFKKLDLWHFLHQMNLTEDEKEEILNHQYYLFHTKLKKTLAYRLDRFSSREPAKRIEILSAHVETIENYFDKGLDTDGNFDKLNAIYRFSEAERKDLIKAYSKVLIDEFDFEEDFLLSVKETYRTHPIFLALFFYNYKKEAKEIIKQLTKPDKKNVRKAATAFALKAPHKSDWLKTLLIQLQFKIEMVQEPSTPETLFDLLTSNDYTKTKDPINLNCETKQFVYIIDKLKPKFSKLTYANIERSKKFLSSEGNLIKADNLSNSKTDYPKDKQEIDAVFTDFMK